LAGNRLLQNTTLVTNFRREAYALQASQFPMYDLLFRVGGRAASAIFLASLFFCGGGKWAMIGRIGSASV
jgi:hypothetical protein